MTTVTLRSTDLVWHDIDGDVVVLDTTRNVYLSLAGSGASVWRQLVQGASQEDLEQFLVTTYDIDPQRAAADISEFVRLLQQHALLES